MSDANLGIAARAISLARRYAARHPSMAHRFLGLRPRVQPVKVHRITVDLPSGLRTVETDDAPRPIKAQKPPKRVKEPDLSVPANPAASVTMRQIVNAVCLHFTVTPFDLFSPLRAYRVAHARFAIYALAKRHVGLSTTQIGRFISRDHTTVVHGLRRAEEFLETNADWRENYAAAERELLP